MAAVASLTDKTEPIGIMHVDGNMMHAPASHKETQSGTSVGAMIFQVLATLLLIVLIVLSIATLVEVSKLNNTNLSDLKINAEVVEIDREIAKSAEAGHWVNGELGENVCKGKKPKHSGLDPNNPEDNYFDNIACLEGQVVQALEQAGADVTKGSVGGINATGGGRIPITEPYWKAGLCPVNVHWHLGAEHRSEGQYDEFGVGPTTAASSPHRHLLAETETGPREGLQCRLYDSGAPGFTKEYHWNHCKDMQVGKTYEVHWPHSAAGACGTPNQYQTPFYDGVFCMGGIISLDPLNTFEKIGVQAQVFTIVNDEKYYYPDLIRGMIVDGDAGLDIAKYTGSTTGTSRSNTVCSRYTPITWQVDRKCHLISASSFDKMCADMKAMRDDMTDDLHPHGAREIVAEFLAANNLQK